jgi:hypothetical protein
MEDSVDEYFCYICPAGFKLENSANSLESVLSSARFSYTYGKLTARLFPVSPPDDLSSKAMSSFNPPLSMNSTTNSPSLIYFWRLNSAILSVRTFLSVFEIKVVLRVRDDSFVKVGSWDAARSESTTARASVIGDAQSLSSA